MEINNFFSVYFQDEEKLRAKKFCAEEKIKEVIKKLKT